LKYKNKKAVALEYGDSRAPRLTAKGDDAMAQAIVEEALRLGVHVAVDAQLVALRSELELDQEIPEYLYTAVAVILSWVYWLKGMSPGGDRKS